jgi:hypothetical protein
MLILQSYTDPLDIPGGSSSDKYPRVDDWTVNANVEKDLEMGEEELNVKTEEGIGTEEETCIVIKYDVDIYSKEEEEEDMDRNEEEVSLEDKI